MSVVKGAQAASTTAAAGAGAAAEGATAPALGQLSQHQPPQRLAHLQLEPQTSRTTTLPHAVARPATRSGSLSPLLLLLLPLLCVLCTLPTPVPQILCMHGGLSPDLKNLEDIKRVARPTDVPDSGLLCDLLWADPDKDIQVGGTSQGAAPW